MRRPLPWLLSMLLLTGCARLDAIPAAPLQTAATWLTIQSQKISGATYA